MPLIRADYRRAWILMHRDVRCWLGWGASRRCTSSLDSVKCLSRRGYTGSTSTRHRNQHTTE
eukprot:1333173-Amorphochlora_amoeboformis.AAC.1